MEHDRLVLNDGETEFNNTKRRNTSLLCYNCESEYSSGQGFISPDYLNPSHKEFCDVSCQLAFAKVTLDDFAWVGYLEAICGLVGYEPYIPPSFEALQRFGGPMTIQEYKQHHDIPKRSRLNNME